MTTMTADERFAKSGIPASVGSVEMAEVLGISPRRLRQLASEGHIDGRLGRDLYDLRRTISTYLEYCRRGG